MFLSVLQGKPEGYLESDTDEQLLIKITFKEKVKLHSLVIQGIEDFGPEKVKLFINRQVLISVYCQY